MPLKINTMKVLGGLKKKAYLALCLQHIALLDLPQVWEWWESLPFVVSQMQNCVHFYTHFLKMWI